MLLFYSSMQSFDVYRLTVRNTRNFQTFTLSWSNYITWKKYPSLCGTRIPIASYCLLTITITLAQHYSMPTRDYGLYYSDKVGKRLSTDCSIVKFLLFVHKIPLYKTYMLKYRLLPDNNLYCKHW